MKWLNLTAMNSLRSLKKITIALSVIGVLAGGLELSATRSASAHELNFSDRRMSQGNPEQDLRYGKLPNAIARAVLQDASQRLQVPVGRLRIAQATPKTFGNPCQFNFGEVCTFEYRPVQGWEVIVQGGRQSLTYHVNRSGSQMVADPKSAAPVGNLPGTIQTIVLQDAARRSGLPINALRITQSNPQTFGNPCIFRFGRVCTREYRPIEGWEVVVRVRGQFWTYHVDRNGSQLALKPGGAQ